MNRPRRNAMLASFRAGYETAKRDAVDRCEKARNLRPHHGGGINDCITMINEITPDHLIKAWEAMGDD
jgi:hypothetical protein